MIYRWNIFGIFFILTIIFASFTIPKTTLAEGAPTTIEGNCANDGSGYCLLEPLPLGTSGESFNNVDETSTLSSYLNTFFKIGIGIIGVLAVIMLIVGGVQYMTTDAIGGKESGKETVTNAIGGLLLALGSYLILVTINPQLISFQFGVHSVNMEGVGPGLPSGVEMANNYNSSDSGATVDVSASSAFGVGTIDDSKERKIFTQLPYKAVISGTVSNNCKKVGEGGCTSLLKLGIDHVRMLRQGCPTCEIVITGGSEYWLHKSHGPNKSIVDLSKTASVRDFIHKSVNLKWKCRVGWPVKDANAVDEKDKPCPGTNGSSRSSIEYWLPDIGLGFVDEGNHYHTTSTPI